MISIGKQLILGHFQWYGNMLKWKFLIIVTLEGTALPYLIISVYSLVFTIPSSVGGAEPEFYKKYEFFIEDVMAPIFETIFFQIIPVFLARKFKFGFKGQLLAAWLPFAAMHFFNNIYSGICAGVIGGFYVAFTYVHWRQQSLWSAIWITIVHHSLSNSLYTIIDKIEGYVTKI